MSNLFVRSSHIEDMQVTVFPRDLTTAHALAAQVVPRSDGDVFTISTFLLLEEDGVVTEELETERWHFSRMGERWILLQSKGSSGECVVPEELRLYEVTCPHQ